MTENSSLNALPAEPSSLDTLQAQIQTIIDADTDDFFELANLLGRDPLRDLAGANLSGTDLQNGNLAGADLRRTILKEANLYRANLSGADLSHADLQGANLREANLSNANLSNANLAGADLSGTNLSQVTLSNANLSDANLDGATLSKAIGQKTSFGQNSDLSENLKAEPDPYSVPINTVEDPEKRSIDFLFDGGGYLAELAIFNLEGMEELQLGSEAFILEAARRALSNSELGHVVAISDAEDLKANLGYQNLLINIAEASEDIAALEDVVAISDFEDLKANLEQHNALINIAEETGKVSVDESFDAGFFTVGETGRVNVDFRFDGGEYRGELAFFNLEGMEEFELGSENSILEASLRILSDSKDKIADAEKEDISLEESCRVLSDSDLGHVTLSDSPDATRFSSMLDDSRNWNPVEHKGIKMFWMLLGNKFGLMFVSNGTVEALFQAY